MVLDLLGDLKIATFILQTATIIKNLPKRLFSAIRKRRIQTEFKLTFSVFNCEMIRSNATENQTCNIHVHACKKMCNFLFDFIMKNFLYF